MKTLIVIGIGIVVVIAVLAAVVALVGSRLPKNHTASRSILLHRPPKEVYDVVRDFGSTATWRSGVKSVEVQPQSNGKTHFREVGSDTIDYEVAEDIPAQRLVTRILNTDLGYSGQWTYEFMPESDGTRVKITEDGVVSNVIFRFLSRYVFGHTATIDSYLTSLGKRLGENVTPS
ncbi:MAG TPA: SRPBCC family protein [Pyrinomonadaceae bacterium]|nr:SRPBCC family protein [Pyrinomonadaceae bacterium]